MKISDVTVTYNNREGLRKTLESLSSQSLSNKTEVFEIIVIDGGSKDGSIEILEEYCCLLRNHNNITIRYISEPDKGIYDAMNKGIDMSTGEWVMFINAGDILYSNNTISYIIDNMSSSSNDSIDIFYGDSARDYGNKIEVTQPLPITSIKKGLPFSHQSVVTRTALFRTRKYDQNYKISGDYEWFLNAYLEKKRFQYIPICISVFDTKGISSQLLYENYIEAEKIRYSCGVEDFWIIRIIKRMIWKLFDCLNVGSGFIEKATGMMARFR